MKRFIKNGSPIPVAKVIINSRGEAQSILRLGLVIGFHRISFEWFKPPIIQRFKCQGFGHIARFCRNKEKCLACAGTHSWQDCSAEKSKHICCVNCGSNEHRANNRGCPAVKKLINEQQRINEQKKANEQKIKTKQELPWNRDGWFQTKHTCEASTQTDMIIEKMDSGAKTVGETNAYIPTTRGRPRNKKTGVFSIETSKLDEEAYTYIRDALKHPYYMLLKPGLTPKKKK